MAGSGDPLRLTTARLILRPVAEADAEPTADLVTSDVSDNLLTWPSPMSPEDALARIKASQDALQQRTGIDFAILRRPDERLVGWIGLRIIKDQEARLGYWLGAHFRGAGFVKEAAPEAIAVAAEFLAVSTLVAHVRKSNPASIAILHALGFDLSGQEELFFKFKGRSEECLRYHLAVTKAALSLSQHI